MDAMDGEIDSILLSKRILADIGECKDFISGGILISNTNGTIKKIFTSQQEINSYLFRAHGTEVFDFQDKVVMSGLVDANVNICSGSDFEDFNSITKAAAAGGFTCLVDNPMFSVPPTSSLRNLKEKICVARKSGLHVDCAFWGGVTENNHNELLSMVNHGCCGFKAFLNPQDSYPEFSHLSREGLKKALETLEETNCVFAIKPDVETTEPTIPDDANLKEYQTYLAIKPSSIEKCGVKMVIESIKEHKMKIHLTDISSSESMSLVQKYRTQKTPKQSMLTAETSHHYLSLSAEEIGNGKTECKCMPPIRNAKNKRGLWDLMRDYEFNNVSSSHMPSSIGAKCLIGGKNRGNFIEAANGIASLQFGLSIMWTECLKNNMSIHDLHRFMSDYPARLCGLEGNKGKLKVGYDADFCIWDPDEEWTITKEEALFKNKISPYFGKRVRGRVYATAVRGMFVYDSNYPTLPDLAVGNVILRKPTKKSERAITWGDADE